MFNVYIEGCRLVGFTSPVTTVDKNQKKQLYLPSILKIIPEQCQGEEKIETLGIHSSILSPKSPRLWAYELQI